MTTYTVSTTRELQQRTADAGAGDEVVARGGTYEMTSRWRVTSGGSSGNPLVIRAADGETPHIRFNTSGDDSGVQFRSPYVHFVGFEVSESSWKGVNTDGNAHDVVFEDLDVHDCHLWGVMNNGRRNVVFRNCDSHHNDGDPSNTDGFNMTGTATNGLIEGCRAWANGDDGFDTWVSENHVIRNCLAWDNGRSGGGTGDGFKLGGNNVGGGHLVYNCVAWDNMRRGFDWNTTNNPNEVYNCTAFNNPLNYRFRDVAHRLRNNISVGGSDQIDSVVDDEYNSWNLGISDPEFESTDPGTSSYLRLSESSPAIDAGVDVDLPYSGSAPDLGAYEFGDERAEPEPTPRTVVDGEVTLVARDAERSRQSLFETEHEGFKSGGYVNFEPEDGGYGRWKLDVAEAQTYTYEIHYANGSGTDRTANMTYAGDYHQITFPATGAWTNWELLTGTVDLPSGELDLSIETTGQKAGNIDQIRLQPTETETPAPELDEEVTLFAHDAVLDTESRLETEHTGFEGDGYVNFEPDSDGYAKWTLDVPEAGRYRFDINYANGSRAHRTANMTFAGDYKQITFPRTAQWTNWETMTGIIDLPSGTVELAIETTGQKAGNVDQIRLQPAGTPDHTLDGEVTLRARDAVTDNYSLFEAEHTGFTDNGYVNFEPENDGYAQWALDVPDATAYNFEIRYANGSTGDRTANMTFAGDYKQITFPQTGGWTSWETLDGTVDLPSGTVELAIETTGQKAGNVDQIRLWPAETEADETRANPTGDTSNHGFNTPQAGETNWDVLLNENFKAIDERIPIVDQAAAKSEYQPVERALYIAVDTGTIYVGDGSEWAELGSLR